MSKDYKHTLLMMKTAFPMRGNLPETELKIEKEWEENNLYHLVLQKNINNPPFILHDGPFYAHGEVHVGHAFNKILKDFVIRYRTMSNYYAPFIPGWDMHGLPIENELIKEGKVSRDNPVAFRHRCREYAYEQLEKQRHTFKRLGILGEWEQPYLTSKNEYVAEQIKMFAHLVKKNLIYKGLKPVYWSPDSGTLLTETEVEYFDKITPSIYFTFQVIDGRNVISDDCELVVWTTSPWTVPANVAICVNPEFQYAVIETEERYLIVASELTDSFIAETQLNGYKIIKLIQGKDLEYITYRHPLNNNIYSVVLGECVNLDAGTGLVHIAPGHGYEDYLIAKKYKLDIVTVLDTKGFLTKETGEFDGIYYEEANRVITLRLKEVNRLVYSGKTVHNYPYDIKNRKPVVYRAVWQWFASIEALREELLDAVKSVNWIPSWGESRIENIIKESGEWCISRQRVWGVPIPVFYAEDGTTLLNPDLINYVAEIFRREGPSAWWRRSAKELLPEGFVSPHSPNGIFIKENDIMDVWFDAGSYHHAAMVSDGYSYPAQLYLESSNQYRGWFNSSLITGVALTGKAPYKTVLTHGFVLDGAGHKMNKTSDTLNPTELVARYGADVLRLWVASVDYTSDVRISPPILKQTEEIYRKIRNTFRFLLGNLFDFRNSKNHIK
ncbi:MAG: isoleucine--tRNA ligase, partial [Bacilli bacterium]|nr:isoleucine--tRNA ligase [Bacilli bacterium]